MSHTDRQTTDGNDSSLKLNSLKAVKLKNSFHELEDMRKFVIAGYVVMASEDHFIMLIVIL